MVSPSSLYILRETLVMKRWMRLYGLPEEEFVSRHAASYAAKHPPLSPARSGAAESSASEGVFSG